MVSGLYLHWVVHKDVEVGRNLRIFEFEVQFTAWFTIGDESLDFILDFPETQFVSFLVSPRVVEARRCIVRDKEAERE